MEIFCFWIKERDTEVHADDSTNQLIDNYPNIHAKYINIETFLEETVLHRLWKDDRVQTSDYAISHLSDVLRYALIFKFGGTYVDTDVIFLKPLPEEESLPNFIGKENEELPHLGKKIFIKIELQNDISIFSY